MNLLYKLFPNPNDKIIKKYSSVVKQINALEGHMSSLTDAELQSKTIEFKNRIQNNNESLNKILPEVFAVCREASKRILHMRHFDVQLIGGMALNDGCIAEARTGEGKTLVATLSAYLNALTGNSVHIVTVNDYLVKRDYEWMGKLYEFLGLTVGMINSETDHELRNEIYNRDIIYITNTEIGFDYLKDNMKINKTDMGLLNKGFNYAIVDEVDSILIDEARTPLIISGPSSGNPKLYLEIDKVVRKLINSDYEIDEKHKAIQLTDSGNISCENLLKQFGILSKNEDLYSINNFHLLNHILQALKAHRIFKINIDYIVKDKEVMLIDEFTGRTMDGRRYSEGLHQAIEAKENVKIKQENQTLASITYQNFFRMYKKLAGMTGTANTEAGEFLDIYKLKVVSVPTNKKVIVEHKNDVIYKNEQEKIQAIIKTIKDANEKGQPILIGTISIDKSERLSAELKKENIKHNLLNAKHHEKEAEIIAEAGRFGGVTIATNMAGRGTDIMLGGNLSKKIKYEIDKEFNQHLDVKDIEMLIRNIEKEHEIERNKVIQAGGLFVVGSERHESRRIDNQLRGRAGRQGDPGATQFFLSLYDDLLRIFGGEKIDNILSKIGFKGGEAMNHYLLNNVIENSQKKIENFHYEMRKNVLKYDDIANDQRKMLYSQRMLFIDSEDTERIINHIMQDVNNKIIDNVKKEKNFIDDEDILNLLHNIYHIKKDTIKMSIKNLSNESELTEFFMNRYKDKFAKIDKEQLFSLEKRILTITLDECWREHLYSIEHLKEGIHLRSFAQKDPFSEYKMECFTLFEQMMQNFADEVLKRLFGLEMVG